LVGCCIQEKYKKEIKKKFKRQVQIVDDSTKDITDDEVDEIMQKGVNAATVLRGAIMEGQNKTSQELINAYSHAAEKYQDVLKLEASVQELHQMFLDLAVLVDQQGELLSNIENQVNNASDFIEKGNKDIKKAIKHQTQNRKMMCCILVVGLCIAAAFVIGFSTVTS